MRKRLVVVHPTEIRTDLAILGATIELNERRALSIKGGRPAQLCRHCMEQDAEVGSVCNACREKHEINNRIIQRMKVPGEYRSHKKVAK